MAVRYGGMTHEDQAHVNAAREVERAYRDLANHATGPYCQSQSCPMCERRLAALRDAVQEMRNWLGVCA